MRVKYSSKHLMIILYRHKCYGKLGSRCSRCSYLSPVIGAIFGVGSKTAPCTKASQKFVAVHTTLRLNILFEILKKKKTNHHRKWYEKCSPSQFTTLANENHSLKLFSKKVLVFQFKHRFFYWFALLCLYSFSQQLNRFLHIWNYKYFERFCSTSRYILYAFLQLFHPIMQPL